MLVSQPPGINNRAVDLSVGQRCTVTVSDLAFGGEGVARVGGFVLLVPFVAPGEQVAVALTEVKRRFARAKLLQVLAPAACRVTPRCRYFGECGGCQYQHLDYPAQLRLKQKQVADLFARIGKFASPEQSAQGEAIVPAPAATGRPLPAAASGDQAEPAEVAASGGQLAAAAGRASVRTVIPCPQPFGYRNRIMVRSQWNKFTRRMSLGFLRYDNRLVVDIEECQIAEPALNAQLQHLRAHPPPHGGLKAVLRLQPEGWEVPPDSFFQNNFFLLPRLVEVVRELLLSGGARFLVDVYCGVGFFSLELAGLVERFVGVELDQRAIKAAQRNATARACANGQFIVGRAEDTLAGLLAQAPAKQTAVILDPPRVGCAPVILERLREALPAQVLYVSCHPATLARDLNILCAGGVYEVMQIAPLDMFPQTQHVECVAEARAVAQPRTPATVAAPTATPQSRSN
jgi:tRNA/tmRNA/rRNA uracil-C5-methylase (TrmA/RlmC/RlmD family)